MHFKVETQMGLRTVRGLDEMRRLVDAGALSPDDHVRALPDGQWLLAREHPAVADLFEGSALSTAQYAAPGFDDHALVDSGAMTGVLDTVAPRAPDHDALADAMHHAEKTHISVQSADMPVLGHLSVGRADVDSAVQTAPLTAPAELAQAKKGRIIAGARAASWSPEQHATETQALDAPPPGALPPAPSGAHPMALHTPLATHRPRQRGAWRLIAVLAVLVAGLGAVVWFLLQARSPDGSTAEAVADDEAATTADDTTPGEAGTDRDEVASDEARLAAVTDDDDDDTDTAATGSAPPGDPLDVRLGLIWRAERPLVPGCPEGTTLRRSELPDGGLESECLTSLGFRDGPWVQYIGGADGERQLVWLMVYRNGELDGVATRWDPATGHKRQEVRYEQGVLHGPTASWDAEGRLERVGLHVGGLRHGRWIERLRNLEGRDHLFGTCYLLGKPTWTLQRALDAWPEHTAVSPADAPELYARACDDAPDAGDSVLGAAVDEAVGRLDSLPETPWMPGTRWVYRITRRGRPGRIDEGSELTYHVVREVVRVDPLAGGAKHVIVEERGGHLDKAVRDVGYRLRERCLEPVKVPQAEYIPVCLQDSDRLLVQRVGDQSVTVRELIPPPEEELDDARVLLAPDIGPVLIEGPDRRGRHTRAELVGFEVGDRKVGDHAQAPRVCDWTRSVGAGRDGSVDLQLTGEQVFARLQATRAGGAVEVALLDADGAPSGASRRYEGLELTRAKTWLPPDAHAEYVLLQLESNGRLEFVVLRLAGGEVEESRLGYDRPVTGDIHALMMAAPESCFVRLSKRQGATSRVRDLVPTRLGLMVGGGSL